MECTMNGRTAIFLALAFTAGCGQRSATITTTKPDTLEIPNVDPAGQAAAALVAAEFISSAKAGKATADLLTDDFKKIIGEPLTPSEKERGFSDAAATEWLKIAGPRLQSLKIVPITNSNGLFELDGGTLRIMNVDSKWRVDWFHAGRPKAVSPISEDNAAKRFTIASFLDPLFTNNWELSEAVLSTEARKSLAPPFNSDQLGYNRGTLRGKLKDFLNGATGYSVTVAGDKVMVTLTGPVERKITLSLTAGPRPDVWLVNGIE